MKNYSFICNIEVYRFHHTCIYIFIKNFDYLLIRITARVTQM